MASYITVPLWLILLTLPHLTCNTVCPSSCLCTDNGAVSCVGNTISDMPKQLPVHTYLLQLNDTSMNVITEQSLANKEFLLRFSLTHSHLHTVHPLAFHAAPQLKSVKLSSNDLSSLPARVLSPLTTLEQLLLDGNRLETFAWDTFRGLVELQNLDLSRNKLSNLTSDVFDGLSNLTFLNLGRNSIGRLPSTIFHSLTKLRHLYLYNNEIEVLQNELFDKLINLEELKMHQNQIASLSPRLFWSLGNLKVLTLSSNRLQEIPEKSFYYMPKLSKLTLYNNPLLSLPDQLMGHMPNMREFYLYYTNLTTVPGNLFSNMSGLLRLNFHINDKLRDLPPDLFCCLPNLQKLSLKANNLQYLHPEMFSRLTTLTQLFLNDNKLRNLPGNIFMGLRGLLNIDLKNNQIKTLPGEIFFSNTRLRALTLGGNPWECTCSIRGIVNWIRHNEHVIVDNDDVICHAPMYQLLRSLGSLRDEEFNFCDATSYPPTNNTSHDPTRPFPTTPTSRWRSGSLFTPPATTSQTTQGATQQTTPENPITSEARALSTPLHTETTTILDDDFLPTTETLLHEKTSSDVFYDLLVLEQGPEFVHHSLHGGWVYVWFLPSDTAWAGLLMFCHILLVTTGLFLILAAMYGMYRLNTTMEKLRAECAQTEG